MTARFQLAATSAAPMKASSGLCCEQTTRSLGIGTVKGDSDQQLGTPTFGHWWTCLIAIGPAHSSTGASGKMDNDVARTETNVLPNSQQQPFVSFLDDVCQFQAWAAGRMRVSVLCLFLSGSSAISSYGTLCVRDGRRSSNNSLSHLKKMTRQPIVKG